MCFFYGERSEERQGAKGLHKNIADYFTAKKMLQQAAGTKPWRKGLVPFLLIQLFQLPICRCALQMFCNPRGGDLAAMQRHAHAVAAKRCDHATGITN